MGESNFTMKLKHLEPFKKWLDAMGVSYREPSRGPVLLIEPRLRAKDRARDPYKIERKKHSRHTLIVSDYASGLVLRFYKAILEARAELEAQKIANSSLGNVSYRPIKGKSK